MSKKKVAIIGAGPAGLTTCRHALLQNCEPTVFEKSNRFGGIWNLDLSPETRSVFEGTTLNHSKEFVGFSDFPVSGKYPNFMSHSDVLEYFTHYVDEFDLLRHIKFNVEILQISRAKNWDETGFVQIEYSFTDSNATKEKILEVFDGVCICTGYYSKPFRPAEFRLEKSFKGEILHSINYKSPSNYKDKTVLLIGFGNSAVKIACDLASTSKKVILSTRRGAWLIPKTNSRQKPWDQTYNSRFHHFGRRFTPRFLQNWIWEFHAQKFIDHKTFEIKPKHSLLSTHFTFSESLPEHLTNKKVIVKPNLLSFLNDFGVEFEDRSTIEHVDVVIFCTGYTFDFPFLENNSLFGVRYNDFHLYKQMFLPDLAPHHTIALIGHLQPTGCIFPIAEMQARFYFQVLLEKIQLPSIFDMKVDLEIKRLNMSLYYIKSPRHSQIEDYVDYMEDLAGLIGVRPNIREYLLTNPMIAYKIYFGPLISAQYRLTGSNVWPDAKQVILNGQNNTINPLIIVIIFAILGLLISLFLSIFQ